MEKVLITGATRGIGLEFVKQTLARGDKVVATCRAPETAAALQQLAGPSLRILPLDAGNPASVSALGRLLAGEQITLYINNAGIYGDRQTLETADWDDWLEVFRVNTIAPLIITRTILPLLGRGARLVYLSSKMGSVTENTGGSTYVYRSSKTALNQVVKSLAIDLAPRGLHVAALHPGWVKTDMGGPNALIDTATSVRGMLSVIGRLDAEGSGRFYNYDGQEIPW